MRSKRGLISIGVVTFVLGLIVLLPARVAYRWMAPQEIAVSGIAGTVWRGNAREASVSGVYLRDLSWRMKPWRLLTGDLAYRITGNPASGSFEADISAGFGGVIEFTSLTADVPLEIFSMATGIRGLQGNASLRFERIEIIDGLATAADGTLQVTNLLVALAGRDSLGGYKAEFFTQNNGVMASIEDTDGVVDLAGSLQISNDRSFRFVAKVIAKPETPGGIRQQLQFLPSADESGQRELRFEGTL